MKIEIPETLDEVQALVASKTPESLHLEYKRSDALKTGATTELTKDVSAFANSDGGCLVYGVVEEDQVPVALDGGVSTSAIGREWLENILLSRIQPRLDDLVINVIPLTATHAIFCVAVSKTLRGPHQSEDKRYYKRFNFKSEPMEDYEIRDVRSRVLTVPPLVSIELELRRGILADLVVQNPGLLPAHDVTFEFEGEPPWRLSGKPPLFSKGIAFLPPGRRFPFFIGSMVAMVGRDGASAVRFTIRASYLHPSVGARLTEAFRFDLNDYFGSSVVESDAMESAKLVADELRKIHDDLSKVVVHLESLTSISGATGLDLSVTAIRNLAANFAGGPTPPKLNPSFQEAAVFMEILGVDWKTGFLLQDYFRRRPTDDIDPPISIPKDVLDRLSDFFDLEAWKRGLKGP